MSELVSKTFVWFPLSFMGKYQDNSLFTSNLHFLIILTLSACGLCYLHGVDT